MKKTLSLILALLMAASTATFALADEAEEVEAIAEEAVVEEEAEVVVTPYDSALQFLNNKQIMIGDENGDLMANENVKRYQMALLMGRVATGWVDPKQWEDGPSNSTIFTDLLGDAADYLGAISYVYQKGIIEGYGDGTFGPDNVVTYRDALTMAVRTLGFGGGYDYPWDYIEKAVSLGLTANISDVTYTDEINRGVAGQIVYNMLFATTANGDTLAKRSFGVEYGWQNIMIVADKYGEYAAGVNEDDLKDGYVAFRVLNADGTLDSTNYYVKGDYKLGRVYNALFESNDNGYVDLIGTCAYEATPIVNNGYTDDEANPIDTWNIQNWIGDYTLVNKYSTKTLAGNNMMKKEIIIADAYDQITVLVEDKDAKYPVAIDWETGDILVWDGDSYEVEWFYNAKLEQYYNYSDVKTAPEGLAIGYDIMDEKDVAKLQDYIAAAKLKKEARDGYYIAESAGDLLKSAWASLEVYDIDGNGVADYGVYEAYRLGTFSTGNKKCEAAGYAHGDDGEKAAYIIDRVTLNDVNINNDGENIVAIVEGACDKCTNDDAHFAEGYEPTKNEDGSYKTGYVIYGYNKSTQEIKIVKEIADLGENTDADSYVATGIVRGHSLSNKSVTIDNTVVYYNADSLVGTPFVKVDDNKGIYSDMFKALLNQFVKYVVVDGYLVDIEPIGATEGTFIVVQDFYGIDSDNYIVVAGYDTDDLKYETYRIASYDGWKTGSAFNYDVIADEFQTGTVYQITSKITDDHGDLYNVTSIGNVANGKVVPVDGTFAKAGAKVTFADGRRFINDADPKKMGSSSKFIIIANAENGKTANGYMPIFVYEGVVSNNNWYIEGDLLVLNDGTVIAVNAKCDGFYYDVTKTGYVAILDERITELGFDAAGREDYYIYGATHYTYEVFDLLKGDKTTVTGTNTDVKDAMVYKTIDGVIVSDVQIGGFAGFKADAINAYADRATDSADYYFAEIDVKEGTDKDAISKYLSTNFYKFSKEYTGLVDGFKMIDVEADGDKVTKLDEFKWADDAPAGAESIKAFLVFDVKGEDVVIYVDGAADMKAVDDTKSVTSDYVIELDEGAYVQASADIAYTEKDGKVTAATIKGLTFEVVGKETGDTHANVDAKGYHFGYEGYCDLEKWNTTVDGVTVPGTIVAKTYDEHEESYDADHNCKLIKAVAVATDVKVDGDTQVAVHFETNTDTITAYGIDYVVHAWIDNGVVKFDFMADGVHDFVLAADMVK